MKLYTTVLTLIMAMFIPNAIATESAREQQLSTAMNAYLYFYPLVTMEHTRQVMSVADSKQENPRFGANKFVHARSFPSADFHAVVRPNFDTLYSVAWIQLDQGPVVLTVPAIKDRFFMLPIMDMYTDVIAVPGTGSVAAQGETFVIVPPGWQGEIPADFKKIEATTNILWVIGRVQTNGEKDYDYVHTLQNGFKLSQLNKLPYKQSLSSGKIDRKTPTLEQVENLSGIDFFREAMKITKANPAHATDWTILQQMELAGIDANSLKGNDLDDLLSSAKASALKLLTQMVKRSDNLVNGWQVKLTDIGVYGNDYAARANITRIGLGANPASWAVYPLTVLDSSGLAPNAKNNYKLHFAAGDLPPNRGFWSVTMYDEKGFQVSNELNRFALGDRSNLTQNEDGSTTIYIQHEKPSADKVNNWLPGPKSGTIGITMRIYGPSPAVLNRQWLPPTLTIVND